MDQRNLILVAESLTEVTARDTLEYTDSESLAYTDSMHR